MKKSKFKLYLGLSLRGIGGLLSKIYGADAAAVSSGSAAWEKPARLTDLSVGVRESYDDNVLLVSSEGNGRNAILHDGDLKDF